MTEKFLAPTQHRDLSILIFSFFSLSLIAVSWMFCLVKVLIESFFLLSTLSVQEVCVSSIVHWGQRGEPPAPRANPLTEENIQTSAGKEGPSSTLSRD